jgi:hypothetical protein
MLHILRALVVFFAFSPAFAGADQSFTYYPPGSLIKNSGGRGISTGSVDYHVYAPDILFPLEESPVFANSQVYNPGGTGYTGTDGKGQCDPKNYTYPWRDNFCEQRDDKNHDYFKLTKAKWDEKYGEQMTFRPDPTGRYQLAKGVR